MPGTQAHSPDSATLPLNSHRTYRLLDPIDRVSEVLFGLIMVLTFTGSLRVATADEEEVRAMLIGALGCNLAWGLIDGILFLMACLAEREGNLRKLLALRRATSQTESHQILIDALPPVVASVLEPAELDTLGERLKRLPPPPDRAHLHREDWLGGLAVFLWVFSTTFPVAVPFIVMEQAGPAMRVSNGIAVVMLFLTGFAYGRCAGRNPWLMGTAMLALGLTLVAMTIALGG